jgi:dipeptidyl aminopeptidase/acylaminoacyl peptidase
VLKETGDINPLETVVTERYARSIWLLDVDSGEKQDLTNGKGDDSRPEWSPDGQSLAFCRAANAGAVQSYGIWVWERSTQAAHLVLTVGDCFGQFGWSPTSRKLYVLMRADKKPKGTSDRNVFLSQQPAMASTDLRQRSNLATVHVYESGLTGENGSELGGVPWNIDRFFDLVAVELRGGHVEPLLNGLRTPTFWVSPDESSALLAVTKGFQTAGSEQLIQDLMILDLATKETRVLATNVPMGPIPKASWSPDGKMIAYRDGGRATKGDIWVVPAVGGRSWKITQGALKEGQGACELCFWIHAAIPPLWEHDGERVLFASNGVVYEASLNQHEVKSVASLPGKQIELLGEGGEDGSILVSLEGGDATIVIARDEQTQERGFFKINLRTHRVTQFFSGGFDCENPQDVVATSSSRSVLYVQQSASVDVDIWRLTSDNPNPVRLTQLNPQLDPDRMGKSRVIRWLGLDGEALQGALLLPTGYQEGKTYPLVVGVYGGGHASRWIHDFGFRTCLPIHAQLLATRGYAVLCPDAPQHLETPMFDLAKAVLPGVNKVIEIGVADANRIGVIGHSYGGYSTLALITQTDRFRAAVDSAGFGDLFGEYGDMREDGSAYGVALLEKGQGQMGGSPWEARDRYIENSPFFNFDRIKTPLLVLHAAGDTTLGSFVSDQVFVSLRRLGKAVVYAKYEGESHGVTSWSRANREDYVLRILSWFEKYLQN